MEPADIPVGSQAAVRGSRAQTLPSGKARNLPFIGSRSRCSQTRRQSRTTCTTSVSWTALASPEMYSSGSKKHGCRGEGDAGGRGGAGAFALHVMLTVESTPEPVHRSVCYSYVHQGEALVERWEEGPGGPEVRGSLNAAALPSWLRGACAPSRHSVNRTHKDIGLGSNKIRGTYVFRQSAALRTANAGHLDKLERPLPALMCLSRGLDSTRPGVTRIHFLLVRGLRSAGFLLILPPHVLHESFAFALALSQFREHGVLVGVGLLRFLGFRQRPASQ